MSSSDGAGALFTDLYELTMLQAYFDEGLNDTAVFDLYVRTLPLERNFLVAAGLEQVLEYLERLAFTKADLAHLESLGGFTPAFLNALADFRFTGSLRALPEGTLVFADEPLLEVEAPLPQAQLIETFLLNQISFQTMIASKGARAVIAAGGRTLVDFGTRRAHGVDAGLKAARALYLAGFDATSNVEAGRLYGIPVSGTMAHSYVQAHADELDAFRAFLRSFPETVLLVDTYDTGRGLRNVVALARESADFRVRAVRLDSGDLAALAAEARAVLDAAGLQSVGIFGSGGLDEQKIDRLVRAGAPFTGFGPGTSVVTSEDAPRLDTAYKLVAYGGSGRMKLSPAKATYPGRKQVWRRYRAGVLAGDLLGGADEEREGEPLLVEVMRDGQRTAAGREALAAARVRARSELARLPPALRDLAPAAMPYQVELSPALADETAALAEQLAAATKGAAR
jgi:nicotinate phosphoribosyltransferase